MDTALLREYRTLHGLSSPQDWLAGRVQQLGFSLLRQEDGLLLASLGSGPSLCLAARMEPQRTESGICHPWGHDAACAMVLTAAARAAGEGIGRGSLKLLFWDGQAEPPMMPEAVEICLLPGKAGRAAVTDVSPGAKALAERCAAAVREVLGAVSDGQTPEPFCPQLGCRIGVGAAPSPCLGDPEMDFRKAALEHGSDILSDLIHKGIY